MKHFQHQILLGIFLIVLSLSLYFLQIEIFHAPRDTFFYLLQDLAFVPIQILIVTVIVDQVLRIREKSAMLNKMNMVIGTFVSEVGTEMLKRFSGFDMRLDAVRQTFMVTPDWNEQRFCAASRKTADLPFQIDATKDELETLKVFLVSKRDFLLRLLENPNLLEHDAFTDLLWSVFHLSEELQARNQLSQLSEADREHLGVDMKRAYAFLAVEWLAYMKHLKKDYPYLFSLAVRMNPFDPAATPYVTDTLPRN